MCLHFYDLPECRKSATDSRHEIAEAILRLDNQFPEIDSGELYRQINIIESVWVSGETMPFLDKGKYYRVRVIFRDRTKSIEAETKYYIEVTP